MTALMYASINGHVECVRALIKAGASIEAANKVCACTGVCRCSSVCQGLKFD